jgi:RNA polymerase sigma-70 factor (ECF subfamily)
LHDDAAIRDETLVPKWGLPYVTTEGTGFAACGLNSMKRENRLSCYYPSGADSTTAGQIVEFERLFSQCEPDLKAFVFTLLPNWSDAEDVLQRTRIVLWQKFVQFQPESNFKAWALQVARFEVCNFRRTRRSDRLCFDDELVASLAEVRTSLMDDLERRRDALVQCLKKLRASDRQIIRHCYGPKSTTTKEAAERLHRPVNTLYKALNRIRRALSDCVQHVIREEQKESK